MLLLFRIIVYITLIIIIMVIINVALKTIIHIILIIIIIVIINVAAVKMIINITLIIIIIVIINIFILICIALSSFQDRKTGIRADKIRDRRRQRGGEESHEGREARKEQQAGREIKVVHFGDEVAASKTKAEAESAPAGQTALTKARVAAVGRGWGRRGRGRGGYGVKDIVAEGLGWSGVWGRGGRGGV